MTSSPITVVEPISSSSQQQDLTNSILDIPPPTVTMTEGVHHSNHNNHHHYRHLQHTEHEQQMLMSERTDQDEYFGLSVAGRLRELSKEDNFFIKMKIMQLFYDLETKKS